MDNNKNNSEARANKQQDSPRRAGSIENGVVQTSPPAETRLPGRERKLSGRFGAQLKRLLVFQAKLYIDAFRDVLLSPLSALAFLLDVLMGNNEQDSYFSKVLGWGRRTERAINLFESRPPDEQGTVDDFIRKAEKKIKS